MLLRNDRENWLNGICPYFTMFPMEFPYKILKEHSTPGQWVADPFCGRGTTNFASRQLGLPSIGIDSSPVAVAISRAKLANTNTHSIVRAANRILKKVKEPSNVPQGEFWELAFENETLATLCRLREELIQDSRSESRKALLAIILGALHGPTPKTKDSYFSNQSQRTYAPKPEYAIKYWRKNQLTPRKVDVIKIIEERAERYFGTHQFSAEGKIFRGDSRKGRVFKYFESEIDWIITSPPYYGMDTYIPDQWLRLWFLGGPDSVEYSRKDQVKHSSPSSFSDDLRKVWKNLAKVSSQSANLIVRFGAINYRRADPKKILIDSLEQSGWQLNEIVSAGFATDGYRQANHIRSSNKSAIEEFDAWAVKA